MILYFQTSIKRLIGYKSRRLRFGFTVFLGIHRQKGFLLACQGRCFYGRGFRDGIIGSDRWALDVRVFFTRGHEMSFVFMIIVVSLLLRGLGASGRGIADIGAPIATREIMGTAPDGSLGRLDLRVGRVTHNHGLGRDHVRATRIATAFEHIAWDLHGPHRDARVECLGVEELDGNGVVVIEGEFDKIATRVHVHFREEPLQGNRVLRGQVIGDGDPILGIADQQGSQSDRVLKNEGIR